MSTELSKTFDPAAVEAEIYQTWLSENCFVADVTAAGEPYSIVIPPPNVTGALHLGHAINTTLQDILTRVHRMRGFNTVWIPGIDHAGIATQAVVEKQLKEVENKTRHDVGRDALVERIWQWKQQYGDRILMQLQRLGCSCDWSRTRFTLDEMCAKAVRETFFKLFKDGLVYRGKRLGNWDIHLQTSISDDEIYHETVKTFLWHIRYRICRGGVTPPSGSGEARTEQSGVTPPSGSGEAQTEQGGVTPPSGSGEAQTEQSRVTPPSGSGEAQTEQGGVTPPLQEFVTVATTRPETLLGDTAVAVHSTDPRWNWAIGMEVELPLTGRRIPIIADDILVDPTFGSGVVKVTPAHDPNDYQVYQRHLGKPDEIGIINLMNPDGTLNAEAGPYAGLSMSAARKKVVADLGKSLVKEEPYETQVGHSDRSKTPVQPYLSDQWFVKMAPLAEPALEVVRDGTIKFFPERHAQQYLSWLGEKRDWPISRQLWWGHRIPVWTLLSETVQPPAGRHFSAKPYTAIWAGLTRYRDERRLSFTFEHESDSEDSTKPLGRMYVCVHAADDVEVIGFIESFGAIQDPDVLDTWFSSALWPHSTLGWPGATADLAKWYPTSVLMTGRDIITLWVARMVMMGLYNMAPVGAGSPRPDPAATVESEKGGVTPPLRGIPFRHVFINPTILDGKGERMSKSKGNGVDPVDIIDTHGADALRFTLTQMATETQDARMPVKKDSLGRNTSDKFDAGRNFCTKLWNAAKFVLSNLESTPATAAAVDENQWSLPDRWIVTRFNRTLEEANTALESYRFDQYHKACYDFFWRDFCDWYVEASKPAMKDPARQAQTGHVLAAVLDGTLRLMHPMIPFVTEKLWTKLNEVRPVRGIPGRIDCPPSPRLVRAEWPTVGEFSQPAEVLFPRMQEIIAAIRNVRNQYKIDPKKPVTVSFVAPSEPLRQIDANREMVELLATCTITTDVAATDAARATAAGVEIFVTGVIDRGAEKQREAKQRETLSSERTALQNRLANPSYADKAPAHLVQQTREKLAAVEAELVKLSE